MKTLIRLTVLALLFFGGRAGQAQQVTGIYSTNFNEM